LSTVCTTSSCVGTERSNPQGEARQDEPASRNVTELDSASLRYLGMAKLPEMPKPATIGQETFTSSQWVPRGGWRQRVGKEKSRNLRDPVTSGCSRESDTLIVARKQGNACGAKGGDCKFATVEVKDVSA
jgi:hypothetical protein